MRLIGAELPSGSFAVDRGFTVPEIEAVLDDIWDVLYGTRELRPGRGLLEVEGQHGHYMLDRDLLTDDLEITIFQGATPPDPNVISPGFWLLGTPRPLEDPSERLPLHLDEVQELRRRAQSLRERAEELEQTEDDDQTRLTPIDELRSRRRVGDAIQRLMSVEAQGVERELRFDDILGECLELLSANPDRMRANDSVARLDQLAEAFEKLERRERSSAAILRWRRLYPALTATGLASSGLWVAGQFMGQQGWTLGGGIGLAASVLPVVAAEWIGRRRLGRVLTVRKELENSAEDILFKARLPEMEGGLHSQALREASEVVGRRDVIRGVRDRLEALRVTGQRRGSKERRAKFLVEGMPGDIEQELTSHWEREPLMALPGLLRTMDRATREEVRRVQQNQRVLGAREGAVDALVHEASELDCEADRLERMDAAVGFIQQLVTRQAKLPVNLQSFLRSIVEPSVDTPRPAWHGNAEGEPAAIERAAETINASAGGQELAWPELEAEIARLEGGLDATARRLGDTSSSGTPAEFEQSAPSALDRIDQWLASRGDEIDLSTNLAAASSQSEAPASSTSGSAAPALDALPTQALVDLRIAPLERVELAQIKPSAVAAAIAIQVPSLDLVALDAVSIAPIASRELPVIGATSAPVAKPEYHAPPRTIEVERAEGIIATPLELPPLRSAHTPEAPSMEAIVAQRSDAALDLTSASAKGEAFSLPALDEALVDEVEETEEIEEAPPLEMAAEAVMEPTPLGVHSEGERASLWSAGLSILSRILPAGGRQEEEGRLNPPASAPQEAQASAAAPTVSHPGPVWTPPPSAPQPPSARQQDSGRARPMDPLPQRAAQKKRAEASTDIGEMLDELLPAMGSASPVPAPEPVLDFDDLDTKKAILPALAESPRAAVGPAVSHYQGVTETGERGDSPSIASLSPNELPEVDRRGRTSEGARVREASRALEEWRRERVRALSRDH